MTTECDDCITAMNHPALPVKRFSMGCNYCAARYLMAGGQDDVSTWAYYGVDHNVVNELRQQGELIDPELKRKGKKK